MSAILTAGRHRLAVADLVAEGVVVLDPAEKADAIYSDPPWGPGNLKYWRTMNGESTRPSWERFTSVLSGVCATRIRPGGLVWLEMGLRWSDELSRIMEGCSFREVLRVRTQYGHPSLPANLLCFSEHQSAPVPDMPVDLRDRALVRTALSTLPVNSVVFDPCCGLGTTARVCIELGLRFSGQELNPKRAARTHAILGGR